MVKNWERGGLLDNAAMATSGEEEKV